MRSIVAVLCVAASLLHVGSGFADQSACLSSGSKNVKAYKLDEGKTLPFAINKPLTKRRPSVNRGREVFLDPDQGNCIACHVVTGLEDRVKSNKFSTVRKYGFQGDVGSSLDGVAEKYAPGELRVIIVNPKTAFPSAETTMPAYYHIDGIKDSAEECVNRTILSEQQIEDLVRYLGIMK